MACFTPRAISRSPLTAARRCPAAGPCPGFQLIRHTRARPDGQGRLRDRSSPTLALERAQRVEFSESHREGTFYISTPGCAHFLILVPENWVLIAEGDTGGVTRTCAVLLLNRVFIVPKGKQMPQTQAVLKAGQQGGERPVSLLPAQVLGAVLPGHINTDLWLGGVPPTCAAALISGKPRVDRPFIRVFVLEEHGT